MMDTMAADKPYKILVVDDEPDLEPLVKQRMRRQIRAGQYDFVFAQNGIQALQRIEEDKGIDMVLSDINMPQMDGLTLLEQIPKIDPNLRAVIISAYGDMKNIRTAMNRGAFDFVTKPVDFDDLRITIDRTLEQIEEWRKALKVRDKLVSLQNELQLASNMQQSILPKVFPDDPSYDVFGTMQPARNVGGDFFDVIRLEKDHLGLAIADVSDKGVPAALFMMSSRTLLKGTALSFDNPGSVLSEVNNMLHEENRVDMFVTMLYAIYKPDDGALAYATGGHDPPLVIHADGSSTLLSRTDGIALGVLPDMEFKFNTTKISSGDTVIVFTDGVTEALNNEGKQFGTEGLSKVFESSPPKDAKEAGERVLEAVNAYAKDLPQHDDITCLALHRE